MIGVIDGSICSKFGFVIWYSMPTIIRQARAVTRLPGGTCAICSKPRPYIGRTHSFAHIIYQITVRTIFRANGPNTQAQSLLIRAMVLHFPVLTKEEFKQGCRDLERRCLNRQCHTDFGDVNFDGECLYIYQKRPQPSEIQEASDTNIHADFVELDVVIVTFTR